MGVGYYMLNFFGGPQYDLMHWYLPGVKHTYKYRSNADAEAKANGKQAANGNQTASKPAKNAAPQGLCREGRHSLRTISPPRAT